MDIHAIGDFLLNLSIVTAIFCACASVVGKWRNHGRLMLSGERAGYAVTAMVVCASFLLISAFITHDYNNKYVAHYSDNNMPWYYLVASFWGGQAGSLMFWSLILAIGTGIVIKQNQQKNRDILPTVLATLMIIQVFFLGLMVFEANPFDTFRVNEPPINGRGLEPLLQNPAMTFHPPSILSGYVWFTFPFAFAVAALVHKRLDDTWIRTTRGYALISWAFLSIGNLFGGMWAYQELGWGGFWGWDPVENASLMPWFTATAYLHSVMIQERRDMLKVWNMALVMLTYFLTVFGTFLTRSGLIDSVHTFAQSDVGDYFIAFLITLTIISIGLIVWRVIDGSLKSKSDVQHLMSREGVFLLNNIVLLACVFVVMFGTIGEKISAYFWQETKYTAPWFNTWMVPGGLLLLLLMGTGPLIPWRKVTKKSLLKNFLVPSAFSSVLTGWLYFADVYHLKVQAAKTYIPFDEAMAGKISWGKLFLEAELVGVYSLIGFWGVFFIFYTMIGEFYKGARVRSRSIKEPFLTAVTRLVSKNKRRYGGYLTHIGFAGLFLGFIGTGLKTERDLSFQEIGQAHILEDKQLTFKGIKFEQNREYREWFAEFELHQLNDDGSVGTSLGMVTPSRRNYIGANVKMSRWTTEKDEVFMWRGNVYLALVSFNDKVQTAEVMAHFNPMLLWMWIGGGILLLGVFVAIWPQEAKYQVFAAAQRSAGRAIGQQGAGQAPALVRVNDVKSTT
jgi:cytochrome c-type biogenesis protein CcmF